jgi:hypothetical protein
MTFRVQSSYRSISRAPGVRSQVESPLEPADVGAERKVEHCAINPVETLSKSGR